MPNAKAWRQLEVKVEEAQSRLRRSIKTRQEAQARLDAVATDVAKNTTAVVQAERELAAFAKKVAAQSNKETEPPAVAQKPVIPIGALLQGSDFEFDMGATFAEAELDLDAQQELETRQTRIKQLFTDFARQAFGAAQDRLEAAQQSEKLRQLQAEQDELPQYVEQQREKKRRRVEEAAGAEGAAARGDGPPAEDAAGGGTPAAASQPNGGAPPSAAGEGFAAAAAPPSAAPAGFSAEAVHAKKDQIQAEMDTLLAEARARPKDAPCL